MLYCYTLIQKIFPLILFCVLCCSLLAQEHRDHHRENSLPQISDSSSLKVLLFSGTGWYRHPDIPLTNGWLVRVGAENNMRVDVSETGKDITQERLEQYDVLLLNNANVLDKVLDEKQRKAVEDWYANGGGIVALHAVLVHQEGWPWIMNLGGCDFNSDSEFLKAKVIVDPASMDHPTVKGWEKNFGMRPTGPITTSP